MDELEDNKNKHNKNINENIEKENNNNPDLLEENNLEKKKIKFQINKMKLKII